MSSRKPDCRSDLKKKLLPDFGSGWQYGNGSIALGVGAGATFKVMADFHSGRKLERWRANIFVIGVAIIWANAFKHMGSSQQIYWDPASVHPALLKQHLDSPHKHIHTVSSSHISLFPYIKPPKPTCQVEYDVVHLNWPECVV